MYEELERRSLLEQKAVQHPYIPFVYIKGKEYFCLKHPELVHLYRGQMVQHIRGKKHGLDFDTGKPTVRTKNLPRDVEEYAKEWANQQSSKKDATKSDPFVSLSNKLNIIFLQRDSLVAFLLAKHGLDGELSNDVMMTLLIREQLRVLEKENKAK